MKILIAPDKFKGSLSAIEVCRAIEEGLAARESGAHVTKTPLADGGEGTVEILLDQIQGRTKNVEVLDPLFRPVLASYGISKDGQTAFIEAASASGLMRLKENERNPLNTSSIGTGQLIADALDEGVNKIIIGIGGSATNDAGIGMASALGFQFFSAQTEVLTPIGRRLRDIVRIDSSRQHPRLNKVAFTFLCDVNNPLHGPDGAAFVYAPQKGATPEEVVQLDEGLRHFAVMAADLYHVDLNFPGAGAAGGLGAAGKLFLNATFRGGIDYVSEIVGLDDKIKASDSVITGEGKVDEQTFSGKVVGKVIQMAKRHSKPVTLVCGQTVYSTDELKAKGVHHVVTLASTAAEVDGAMRNTYSLLIQKLANR